jgi:ring-1,2-phenylacetyl-CoA epoxidase subunit PaaD
MQTIEDDIRKILADNGLENITIETTLTPAWTTDWMSEAGRKKLREYGIAPPVGTSKDKSVLFGDEKEVACPQCRSMHTKLISQFGSTACKAMYKCEDCLEPFDYFKCI